MASRAYATLAQVKAELPKDASKPDVVALDQYINRAIGHVSNRIDLMPHLASFEFEPVLATEFYDAYDDRLDHYDATLLLGRELLEPLTVTDNGTADALTLWDRTIANLSAADYETLGSQTPYTALRRLNAGWVASLSSTTRWNAISVTGYWGYRTDYAAPSAGWVSGGDTLTGGGISAGDTSFTVDDADGDDYFLNTPRFSVGQLIRLDDEFFRVLGITDDTLSVKGAQNGTVAADHPVSTEIDIWYPEPAINRAAIRWVAYLYKSIGRFSNFTIDAVGAIQFPTDIPGEVAGILAEFGDNRMPVVV
jgi:hypothetical protein